MAVEEAVEALDVAVDPREGRFQRGRQADLEIDLLQDLILGYLVEQLCLDL